jgi:hypothetical protein
MMDAPSRVTYISALEMEVADLTARLREQAAMLRRLEWAVDWSRFGIASNHCPVCGNERSHGHASDCELAGLLAALPGAAGEEEGE